MPNLKSPLLILVWNALIVFAVFLVVDVIAYGLIWPGPLPYQDSLCDKIIYTIILSFGYAHIYNKASLSWRPKSDSAFLHRGKIKGEEYNNVAKGYKIWNGLVFGLITTIVIISAIALLDVIVSSVFIYVLEAFNGGDILGTDATEAGVLAAEVVVAGVILETHGKTEDDGIPPPTPTVGG